MLWGTDESLLPGCAILCLLCIMCGASEAKPLNLPGSPDLVRAAVRAQFKSQVPIHVEQVSVHALGN